MVATAHARYAQPLDKLQQAIAAPRGGPLLPRSKRYVRLKTAIREGGQCFRVKVHAFLVQFVMKGLRQSAVIFVALKEAFGPAVPGCLASLDLPFCRGVHQQSTQVPCCNINAVLQRKESTIFTVYVHRFR